MRIGTCTHCSTDQVKIKARGLCANCYARWMKSDDKDSFNTTSGRFISKAIEEACINGEVSKLLEQGATFEKIGNTYGVSRHCASLYVDMYGLRKKTKEGKKSKYGHIMPDLDSMTRFALCSPWRSTNA